MNNPTSTPTATAGGTNLVVVGHVEDDGQLALIRAVVHKHHAPDLHKPSEALHGVVFYINNANSAARAREEVVVGPTRRFRHQARVFNRW